MPLFPPDLKRQSCVPYAMVHPSLAMTSFLWNPQQTVCTQSHSSVRPSSQRNFRIISVIFLQSAVPYVNLLRQLLLRYSKYALLSRQDCRTHSLPTRLILKWRCGPQRYFLRNRSEAQQ